MNDRDTVSTGEAEVLLWQPEEVQVGSTTVLVYWWPVAVMFSSGGMAAHKYSA